MKSVPFQENTGMVGTTLSFCKFGIKLGKMLREKPRPHGTPSFGIIHLINEDEKVPSKKQKLYHSGVGMFLYLAEYSRSDIKNAVRELSKVLDGAN